MTILQRAALVSCAYKIQGELFSMLVLAKHGKETKEVDEITIMLGLANYCIERNRQEKYDYPTSHTHHPTCEGIFLGWKIITENIIERLCATGLWFGKWIVSFCRIGLIRLCRVLSVTGILLIGMANNFMSATDKLLRLKAFRDDLKVNRAKLAEILGVTWVRVSQLSNRFESQFENGELLISVSSVEEYYRIQKKLSSSKLPPK